MADQGDRPDVLRLPGDVKLIGPGAGFALIADADIAAAIGLLAPPIAHAQPRQTHAQLSVTKCGAIVLS
jgi:hypothetical protein